MIAMHTIEELEYIRRGILDRGTLDQQELVYFARSLHELFLSVGLDSRYKVIEDPLIGRKVPDSYYPYYMATSTEVRVIVGTFGPYDLHVQVTVSGYSPTLMYTFGNRHPTDDIQRLVDGLHGTCKIQEAWAYCRPCHYSDASGDYCGLGIGPALGCTHLTTTQTHD